MNITGGKNNSRIITTPDFINVKPTLSKIRQAVFSAVSSAGEYSTFLDLFSGSGIMAFEADSRGFWVTAVEKDKKTADFIRKNIKTLICEINFYNTDAIRFLNSTENKFDVIYIDPPYDRVDLYENSLKLISERQILSENGLVIVEKQNSVSIDFLPFIIFKKKEYSDKEIVYLTKT